MENGPRKSGVFQPPPQIFSILTFCNNKLPPVKRHIPNIITSLNLVSGCIASYFAANANLDFALYFMLLGLLFDFFDGFTARLLGVSSPLVKNWTLWQMSSPLVSLLLLCCFTSYSFYCPALALQHSVLLVLSLICPLPSLPTQLRDWQNSTSTPDNLIVL